jgi:hypothetical protein
MKAAQHRLVGYDRKTEVERFELSIPARMFREVGRFVVFDDDDPDAIGCYELTDDQAHRIAGMVRGQSLSTGLDFFLEANAA